MSAEIIQFVPRPNSSRPSLIEAEEAKAVEFLMSAAALVGLDTTPSDYTAPTDDCA